MEKILLVEDDVLLAEGLVLGLKANGFQVSHVSNLSKARAIVQKEAFELILLDVNLPDGVGYDFCKDLREAKREIPIIFLTARADEDSAVKGFAQGAADYMRKPFGINELVARIRRVRNREISSEKNLELSGLLVNGFDRRATFRGTELSLTRREFDILTMLLRRAGGALSKEQILGNVDEEGNMSDSTLATHISNLRRKLEAASENTLTIGARYGQGYYIKKR